MKSSSRPWMGLLGLVVGYQMVQPAQANDCTWVATPGPIHYAADVGTVYVPRDARIGSIIGVIDKYITSPSPGPSITCSNDGNDILRFRTVPTAPSDRRVHEPIGVVDSSGNIFMTNIPGVGARITVDRPFALSGTNTFIPVGGSLTVPFEAENRSTPVAAFVLGDLRSKVTLVKTGPIPAGSHSLNRQIFDGYFSGGIGSISKGFSYGVVGTVMQAQCAVGATPMSFDPVPLGDWSTSDFTHVGYTTTPIPFTITLTDCEADPDGFNKATANIRLDGANGSMPVGDGSNGVLSLGTGSTAQGMGIQILRSDTGAPVPMGTDVAFGFIENGVDKILEFKASFYQTHDSNQIGAGEAKGSLGFTLTYQ